MAERTINLGCMKIHTKSDTKHYAPWHVINPQLFNPIPADAKTYKLSPSTTLFFKMPRCSTINFGWRQIKTKPKPKEKNMYKSKPFSEREYAAVDRSLFTNNYYEPKTITNEQRISRLRENRSARKSMSFWQKAQVFLVEAEYDISRFFENERYSYQRYYRQGTPGDKLTASFIKQNKEGRNTFNMRTPSKKERGMSIKERRLRAKEKSLGNKLASFFQKEERLPVIIENVIPNETIVPNAPPIVQPERNPEYKEGTTINNYTFNVTCGIL